MIDRFCGGCAGIVTAGLLLFALLIASALAQDSSRCDKTCQARFRGEWRNAAISTLRAHLKRHQKCEMAELIPTLENMQMFFPLGMKANRRAEAFPVAGTTYPMIFINPELTWIMRDVLILLVHEATHLTERKGGWLCGPDAVNRKTMRDVPSCQLFGKVQMNSDDLDRDIAEHLAEELGSTGKNDGPNHN